MKKSPLCTSSYFMTTEIRFQLIYTYYQGACDSVMGVVLRYIWIMHWTQQLSRAFAGVMKRYTDDHYIIIDFIVKHHVNHFRFQSSLLYLCLN